jgi:hypothetical protein
MNLVHGLLILVGAGTAGVGLIAFIIWVCTVIKRVHRVAKDYHETAPSPEVYGSSNYISRLQDGLTTTKNRLYIAERNGSNACLRIDHHVRDNKHTLTAKAVKRTQERKRIEKEQTPDSGWY